MSGLDANKVIPSDADTPAEDEDAVQPAITVQPLPDVTMDNLDNATLAISLEEDGAYLDDTGVSALVCQPFVVLCLLCFTEKALRSATKQAVFSGGI